MFGDEVYIVHRHREYTGPVCPKCGRRILNDFQFDGMCEECYEEQKWEDVKAEAVQDALEVVCNDLKGKLPAKYLDILFIKWCKRYGLEAG